MLLKNVKEGDLIDVSFDYLTPIEKRENLEAIAYQIKESVSYVRKLSPSDLDERKTELSESRIEIDAIEEEKKAIIEEIKARLKPLSERKKELLNAIKHKSETVNGDVYLVDDQEDGKMYEFDSEGVCINVRNLLRSEKQTRIKQLKSASNG
jgi:flagellar motility protein MotE (MotC chaperone)